MKDVRVAVWICLLILLLAGEAEGRKRKGEKRTTEEIILGCTLLGVFLIVVAVCTLYCRFCTKRKREERKLAKNAVDASLQETNRGEEKPVSRAEVAVSIPNIDITAPENDAGEKSDMNPDPEVKPANDDPLKTPAGQTMTSMSEID